MTKQFSKTLAEYEIDRDPRTGAQTKTVKSVYAAWDHLHTRFGFLRADLVPFKQFIEFGGLDPSTVRETVRPLPIAVKIENEMKDSFKPRDKQIPATEFLSNKDKLNRVIDAATGFGKSFLGLNTAMNCEERAGFIMEPSHIKTWLNSIPEQTHLKKSDICVVQGSAGLRSIIDLQKAGQNDYKLIFFSAPTLRNYYKEFEGDMFDYDVKPWDLFEFLGIGTIIRDEVHEAINALVKQVIYTHVRRIIFLSATLVSDNAFINKIYDRVFPKEDRWKSEDNKHICVRSVLHDMYDPQGKIKFRGFKGYSHVKYEQSIMKHKKVMKQYLTFIERMAEVSFVKKHKDGLKMLMIFSTKDMCKQVSEHFREAFPDFSVGCYIAGAKSEELYDRDIVISTPKGAGTGVDIPNLSVGWLTVGLSSTQLSRQIMGRLRPIKKYPDMDPMFLYLTNKRIPAHKLYDDKRKVDVRFRSKNLSTVETGFILKAA